MLSGSLRLRTEDNMRIAALNEKLLLTGLTIALAGFPLSSRAQTKDETDQRAIVAVIDRFVEAWNRQCEGVRGRVC
jgi:hypothetical protein